MNNLFFGGASADKARMAIVWCLLGNLADDQIGINVILVWGDLG